MMDEVQGEFQEKEAEDEVVNRASELRTLNENIDKATNSWVNATLQLESAIQQYQRAEVNLSGAVKTISQKVETINTHIDNVIKDAPLKLKVTVGFSDADKEKIAELFDKEHQLMIERMQAHFREVNDMFANERKRVRERYKKYDGCYLGHYAQWFFWFFFTIGIFVVVTVIVMLVGQEYQWFK